MPGMPSWKICSFCAGVSSRLIHTNPLSLVSRSRSQLGSRSGRTERDLAHRLFLVDHPARLGVKRGHADIDGHLQPVTVEDGGAAGGDDVARLPLDAGIDHDIAELDQPPNDHQKNRPQRQHHEADTGFGQIAPAFAGAFKGDCVGSVCKGHVSSPRSVQQWDLRPWLSPEKARRARHRPAWPSSVAWADRR